MFAQHSFFSVSLAVVLNACNAVLGIDLPKLRKRDARAGGVIKLNRVGRIHEVRVAPTRKRHAYTDSVLPANISPNLNAQTS